MIRADNMERLFVLASNNRGKVDEINRLLSETSVRVVPQSDFGVAAVEETGRTFVENAILKAREASRVAALPAIADDSGLEVDALGGAPGVRSSRFAGEQASDADNNRRLLELLENVSGEQRAARFRCVMVCLRHENDPSPIICEGTWEGSIVRRPSGSGGFGYDPLFRPEGSDKTAAELSGAEKDRASHRGMALRQLVRMLQGE